MKAEYRKLPEKNALSATDLPQSAADRGRIIAMWSGPRNLSTAMMRSFSSRADCTVMDEPFYAAFLAATGIDHPMRAETIASQPTDPDSVVRQCLEAPARHAIVYQKHMTHHMLDGFDLTWVKQVTNVFLIREPERVLASYANKRETVSAEDIGVRRQWELFEHFGALTGQRPVVIDSAAIRADPEGQLRRLCAAISIAFDPAMLSWPAGRHDADGVWSAHWYDAVWRSTGFAAAEGAALPALAPELAAIANAARPCYDRMAKFAL
ncbi:MAG: hypothetical protein KDJ80_11825 [Nitratireductor sp.]|nr:hypothetical protein [Nitratireductor sp.]